MATIDRRTTAELLTELQNRLGKANDSTNYPARGKELLSAAYRYCALRFHHYELDTLDTSLALTQSDRIFDISSLSFFIVMAVDLRDDDASGSYIKPLIPKHATTIFAQRYKNEQDDEPGYYARFGDKLYLDRPPDKAYKINVYYYKKPADLDDASGSPSLAQDWDEIILTRAEYMGHSVFWRPDLAESALARYNDLVSSVVQPLLVDVLQPDHPERSTLKRLERHGGPAQG